MRKLWRILHWRARATYWRKQAQSAKREVARLQLSLLAERYRNMAREDTFVSASVMGSRQMFGVAPRLAPASIDTVASLPAPSPTDPFNALPWPDKAEFETEWLPLALAQGRSEMQARQDFLAALASRQLLKDDYANN